MKKLMNNIADETFKIYNESHVNVSKMMGTCFLMSI